MPNPFFHGNPVPPDRFVGRRKQIRLVASRIVGGQSSAIVSDPRWGKTSLLRVLGEPDRRQEIYGPDAGRLLFHFFDAQGLGCEVTPEAFWSHALGPLDAPGLDLGPVLERARATAYGAQSLRDVLAALKARGLTLVLLLDELDNLVQCESLRKGAFFGVLRSVTTLSGGSLALVSASRKSVAAMNEDTADISGSGSPFFNFAEEVLLGPLSERDVDQLLSRAGTTFEDEDRVFLKRVAGGHPYVLQVAAGALWNALTDEEIQLDRTGRRVQAAEELRRLTAANFASTWKHWSASRRRVFVSIALAQMPAQMEAPEFDLGDLKECMDLYGPEIRELESLGYTEQDLLAPLGGRVTIEALLWWLADELSRVVRDEKGFEEWIRAYHMDGVLTRGQRDALASTTRGVMGLLKNGVRSLVESAATGMGTALLGKAGS